MPELKQFDFSLEGITDLKKDKHGENWPVVYVLNNDKEIYVGETANAYNRMNNHYENKERKKLKTINLISDEKFNKSAILDIESLLIQYLTAEDRYKLQNRNGGQSQKHDYYQKQYYLESFSGIWELLRKKDIVVQELEVLKNSDLFKFSPFKTLTSDQYEITKEIAQTISEQLDTTSNTTFLVNGSSGTGKTVLAIYLVKYLYDISHNSYDVSDIEEEDSTNYIRLLQRFKDVEEFSIGLVVPMVPLRKTLKKVFKSIPGLKAKMVIGPNDVVKKDYDLLIVDEAHRLNRRNNLNAFGAFDTVNKKLGLKDGNQLDWILLRSKYQILFYDDKQSVKPSDVSRDAFRKLEKSKSTQRYRLTSQLRVKGGDDYIKYIHDLLDVKEDLEPIQFDGYDFKIFDDVDKMVQAIKEKDKKYGLCRTVAGYSWKWKTKNKTYDDIIANNEYDIDINGHHFIWNTVGQDWANSKHAKDETGCIHTIQGYDLNYAGVIIGKEIDYDPINKTIIINKDQYFDPKGKAGEEYESLRQYIINIYGVLLTRGILGTYVYVCNENLREYLEMFLSRKQLNDTLFIVKGEKKKNS